jgi:phage gp29-like protein
MFMSLTHSAANAGGYPGATIGDAGAFGRAADCRCSSCSRVACAQAAAAARVAGKDGILKAAERGDVSAKQDYLIADASCMEQQDCHLGVRLDAAQRCMHSDICF